MTPDPRGFPRKSLEAAIADMLCSGSQEHWSFDSEADAKNKERQKALNKLEALLKKKVGKCEGR